MEPAGEDEPLELDDRRVAGNAARAIDLPAPDFGAELELDNNPARAAAITARIPASRGRGRATLEPPPSQAELPRELDPALASQEAERLPEDAILTPQAEDLAAGSDDEQVLPREEASPAAPAAWPAPRETFSFSDEIEVEDAPPAATAKEAGGPIADLLAGVTAEIAVARNQDHLDAAFDRAAPNAPGARRVPVKKVPLFDDLSQDAFVELVNKVGYHRHAAGQRIIREGDPGRSFFVDRGRQGPHLQAHPGRQGADARAPGGGRFLRRDGAALRRAAHGQRGGGRGHRAAGGDRRGAARAHHQAPQVINSLKNFYRQRLLNNVMAISPLFKDFDPSERKAIVEKFRMKRATAGEVLIHEGHNSDGLYVVLHGAVQVSTRKEQRDVELARLSEGEIFGEMSLLTRKPATATVTSSGNALLLRLPRENFQELVVTHPQILELVSELTNRRKGATEAILHGQGEGHDGMSFV